MMDGMRRALLPAMLVTLLAACTAAGLSPAPAPGASGSTATAGAASTEPATTASPTEPNPGATGNTTIIGTASSGPGATTKPGTARSPSPLPAATAPPLDRPGLRYRLIVELGRLLFCDPDYYPIAHSDEAVLARQHLPEIRADQPTYAAIAAHLGIDPSGAPTDGQVLAIYREWKMLRALILTPAGGRFTFDYIAAAGTSEEAGWHVTGTIDAGGTITVASRDPSGPPQCPICLARGTRIATPAGERPVEDLRPGMAVWTVDGSGRRVIGRVMAVGSTPVPATHRVVHLVLSDGRTVDVSPGHQLPDGRRLGDLRPGEPVDGATVVSAELGTLRRRGDVRRPPSGPTGTYWANGIRLASTLKSPVTRIEMTARAGMVPSSNRTNAALR